MELRYQNINGEENLLPNNSKYRRAIGALFCISTTAWPHISKAVNNLSLRNENPKERDWNAVKPAIKYLKTAQKLKLIISNKNEPILTTHADSAGQVKKVAEYQPLATYVN